MTDIRELIYNLLEVADCYSDGRETYEPFEQVLREARSYLLNGDKPAMTEHNPITPPPELVQQWGHDANLSRAPYSDEQWAYEQHIATRAAQWGSDQELEACLHWASEWCSAHKVHRLLAARRPKHPSLKQQALDELAGALAGGNISPDRAAKIRLALEQLDD